MEINVKLKIEEITRDDGSHYFLATSDDVQGLVAQGDTLDEVVEIAADLTKLLFEVKAQRAKKPPSPSPKIIDYPLVVKL